MPFPLFLLSLPDATFLINLKRKKNSQTYRKKLQLPFFIIPVHYLFMLNPYHSQSLQPLPETDTDKDIHKIMQGIVHQLQDQIFMDACIQR